jgi:hypothetical protein
MRDCQRCLFVVIGVSLALLLRSGEIAGQVKTGKPLTGLEAARYCLSSGMPARAETFCIKELWTNIRQPVGLEMLSRACEVQKKDDEAAAYATLLLRLLADSNFKADAAKYKDQTERRLGKLNKDWDARKAKYAAASRKFETPEKVDDLWMTQVQADILSFRDLQAHRLLGGMKDGKPDWIHNAQGVVHRSGMKFVDTADERQGVLFTLPVKTSSEQAKSMGHPTQLKMSNTAKGQFLRIGAKGYNSPFVLKVQAGGKEIFSQTVTEKAWADLRIDLKEVAGKPEEVIVELSVPENQAKAEGAWIDYLDFFEN